MAAPPKSPNDTIRIACVGLRGRGKSHLQAFTSTPNVDLVALCDIDQSVLSKAAKDVEAKRQKPPATYTDLRRLLEDKSIDAISIATPNHQHTLQTIWACQAGKDVYVEKPCSHNMFEAKQIVAAARKYDRIVQQGSQSRSSVALREAVQKMNEGVIGDVYMARGLCYKWRKSIGHTPVEPVPPGVDYDLWLGPAPKHEFTKNRFHYNWHWFWDYGISPAIEGLDVRVQLGEQPVRIAEVAVQIDLSEQQRQILEILRVQVRSGVVAPFSDPPPVTHDVLIVGEQQVLRQFWPVKQELQIVMVKRDVVLVEPFQFRRLQRLGQFLDAPDPEQIQHPLMEDEPLLKAQRFLRAGAACAACGSSSGHLRRSLRSARLQTSAAGTPVQSAALSSSARPGAGSPGCCRR